MPHLVQMDKRYSKKGLRVIAPERQGSSKDDILKMVKKSDMGFTVTDGSTTGPNLSNSIPHAMVFDTTGKMVFSGHPGANEFERSVKQALKDVPEEAADDAISVTGSMIASRTWTNSDGNKIVASVQEVNETSVKFQMSNGRSVDYPLEKLSDEDQEILKKAAADKGGEEAE